MKLLKIFYYFDENAVKNVDTHNICYESASFLKVSLSSGCLT